MTIVQSFVESVEGVSNVEVDLAGKKVTITYDSDLIGPTSLIRCIEEAGRESKVYQASLYVPPRPREAERKHEIQTIFGSYIFILNGASDASSLWKQEFGLFSGKLDTKRHG
ncbi:hypothetical protein ACFX13_028190 [Malus domestica]